ncbi:MFS transporter [Jiangella ureilytica]|uniref:MFS transporter n=1 Tax=Jiangella ureilytica TaxID=2530374 RepID=UPI0013A5C526|nr:MFS transporter [Jiangella ureilytica]
MRRRLGPAASGWLGRVLLYVLLTQLAIFLIRPVLTYRALDLGAGDREVGLLVVAFALVPAAIAIPLGRLSDRRRPAIVVQGGAVLLVVGSLLLYLASNLTGLALATVVLGSGAVAGLVGAQAVIARLAPDAGLDRDFGLLTAAASVGQMIGPPLAGLLLSADADRSTTTGRAFLVGGALLCVALLVCWRLGDGAGRTAAATAPDGKATAAAPGALGILRLPGVRGGIVASLTLLTAVDLLIAYLPVIGEERGISPGVVGLLLSVRAAASVLSRLLIPPMLRRWGRTRLLWASTLGTGVLLGLLPLAAPIWLLALLLAVAGFLLGIGQPLTMSLVVQAVPAASRGAALSIRIMGNRLGQVVLPAGIAVATGVFGAASAFVLVGGLLVMSAVGVPRQAGGTGGTGG